MRVLDSICDPGLGGRANEDRVGFAGNIAWVLDGGTSVADDVFLPAASDVQWLVDRVQDRLNTYGHDEFEGSATDLIWSLRVEIATELAELGFPADRLHPTCTIGVALDRGDRIELCRVGDPTLVVGGRTPVVLHTSFFDRREASAVAAAEKGSLSAADAREGIVRRRLEYIVGSHEESVFSGHPDARLKTGSIVVPAADVDGVLLCTDGLARAVLDYEIFAGWEDLVDAAREKGLDSVLAAVRNYEHGRGRHHGGHFKESDDAAAILLAK
jgi:hypothetical protein